MGRPRNPCPHLWITGPDPRRHEQYVAWMRSKAQANFRREHWTLTFEQFEKMWNQDGAWESRGRSTKDLMMTRLDDSKGWTKANTYIVERGQHLSMLAKRKLGTYYRGLK